MGWRVRGVRGATTVDSNTVPAISRAVTELLEEMVSRNSLSPEDIVSATFTATTDIDAVFPAKIARSLPNWDRVPLLDVQQMHVEGSLPNCIRVLLHINTELSQAEISHVYLGAAKNLRPDL